MVPKSNRIDKGIQNNKEFVIKCSILRIINIKNNTIKTKKNT